jgi:nucleoside-diphosphate-sugar epimerase
MKIYVTGASGFVGGAVVKAWAGKHELLAMPRSEGLALLKASLSD